MHLNGTTKDELRIKSREETGRKAEKGTSPQFSSQFVRSPVLPSLD